MIGKKSASDGGSSSPKGMMVSNRINQGTELLGELVSDGDIRIEGVIKGTIRCKAKVAIGPSGRVEGDIFCKNADVEGRVSGDLDVQETLLLKATARLEGNIQTGRIIIENGALFDGLCSMKSGENRKQVEKAIAKALEPEKISS